MKNPITNTLFRFVSYRSPQLATVKEQATKFVNLPGTMATGLFFDAVNNRPAGTSKMAALHKAAEAFKDDFTDPSSVEALSPTLYDFSIWMARNRGDYSPTELKEEIAKVEESLDDPRRELVWNNFFYQVITQKSFYVKEALMQILVADHVFKLYDKGADGYSEHNDDILNADVTLPVALFDDSSKADTSGDVPQGYKVNIPTGYVKKELSRTAALLEQNGYETLKKELSVSEKTYFQAYYQAYNVAYKEYLESIKPTLDKYYNDVEDARLAYCATHISDTPYDPNDPCQQPPEVPYPSIEPFEFSYEPEITKEKMESELDETSYLTLLQALGYNFDDGSNEDIQKIFNNYSTYKSINAEVDIASRNVIAEAVRNTEAPTAKINIGGVPVSWSRMPAMASQSFNLCGVRILRSRVFTLTMGVPDNTWQVLKIKVTVHLSDHPPGHWILPPTTGIYNNGSLVLNAFFTYVLPDNLGDDNPTLDFEITFTNGNIRTIKGIDALITYCVNGVLDGTEPEPEPEPGSTTDPFVPSGFGFRNLGVADYLKLEQTVQCYVEGEVSHIENIMAREYKERATRSLRRSEEINTESTETEREQLSDTTTADRFEMQSEVAEVLAQSQDMGGFVNANYKGTNYSINSGVSFASNNSKENSIRQATTTSQEITNRALDRVVNKVKKERVTKILEEFEENNKHGFDNRQGSSHVVGVYRWVDKLYKNQIYNYGSRMMLEFMIPEPAKLHLYGMGESSAGQDTLVPPFDPRTYDQNWLIVPSYVSMDQSRAAYWGALFGVETEPYPLTEINVGKEFAYGQDMVPNPKGDTSAVGLKGVIEIPEGYRSDYVHIRGSGTQYGTGNMSISVGSARYHVNSYIDQYYVAMAEGYTKSIPVSIATNRFYSLQINVTAKCVLTAQAIDEWKERNFKAIIEGYEKALAAYNEKIKNMQASAEEAKRVNPGFLRQIENTILRKNCISYLLDRRASAPYTYGKDMSNNVATFGGYEIDLSAAKNLSSYASFVQFMEQAFEWDIMSYNFYPYYWGSRSNWDSLYTYDGSDDPIFRSFMQSGMARVIVTVRPGFEDAVGLYMSTGLIWNGGRQPQLEDPLYVSLIAEVKKPKSEKYGKAWITRVPTALTILQADSIGLKVEKALPCDCGNASEFEPGTVIPCNSDFEITDAELNQGKKVTIQFTFQELDHSNENENNLIGFYDQEGYFPRRYECMGHSITIDRDAAWQPEDSTKVIFEKLAEELSLIAGVNVQQVNSSFNNMPDGLIFKIDTSVNSDFTFKKMNAQGNWNPDYDLLRVITSNDTVRVVYNTTEYVSKRILDRFGVPILESEQNTLLSLSRFKYE